MRLNAVIPWGRSFEEYRRMFALSDADLAGRILGCGDGPASFNAEATGRGHAVVSCDPIYAFSPGEIERRVQDCYAGLIAQVRSDPDGFVWDHFHDPDHLGRHRLAAMRRFLADFEAGKVEGRYVAASLPRLAFEDRRFGLALVSHLLFPYLDLLDFGFHRAAVEEMLRVAGEVRIFPLLTLDRKPSPHVGPIRAQPPGGAGRPRSVASRMSSSGAAARCCGSGPQGAAPPTADRAKFPALAEGGLRTPPRCQRCVLGGVVERRPVFQADRGDGALRAEALQRNSRKR